MIACVISFLAIFPPLLGNAYVTSILILSLFLGTLGSIYDLQIGYAGIMNFGFAGFVGLGAYMSAMAAVNLGISPWIGMLIGGTISGIVGLAAGFLILRLRRVYVAMITWFLAEIIRYSIANLPNYTRGYVGLYVPVFPSIPLPYFNIDFNSITRLPYYYVILIIALSTLTFLYVIVKSRIGMAFRAIREDEIAAEMLGVDTTRYKILNLTVSCFLCGLLGSFYAHYTGIITPDLLGIALTVEVLCITYVGGRGTLWGPMIAAFALTFFLQYFEYLLVYRVILYGVLLLTVAALFPGGLFGVGKAMKRAFRQSPNVQAAGTEKELEE